MIGVCACCEQHKELLPDDNWCDECHADAAWKPPAEPETKAK